MVWRSSDPQDVSVMGRLSLDAVSLVLTVNGDLAFTLTPVGLGWIGCSGMKRIA